MNENILTPSVLDGARQNILERVRDAIEGEPEAINSQDPATLMTALHWAGANRNLGAGKAPFCSNDPQGRSVDQGPLGTACR